MGVIYGCYSLKYDDNDPLDLSEWTLPNISDMTYAFGSDYSDRTAWRNNTGKAAFSELKTLKLPAIKNGVTTTNMFTFCEGLANLNIQSLESSLSLYYCNLTLQSAKNILTALQDVTSYGGATLTFSSTTKGYINNDATALALVANAVNNLGWTIALN